MDSGRAGQIFFTDAAFTDKKIEDGARKRDTEYDGEPCQGHPHGPSPHDDTGGKPDDDEPVGREK